MPIFQSHPWQRGRRRLGQGLAGADLRRGGDHRCGRRGSVGRPRCGRPPVGARGGELRGPRQGVGRQHRRRPDGLGVGVHPAVPELFGRSRRCATTGRTSGCPRCTATRIWRRSTGRPHRRRPPTRRTTSSRRSGYSPPTTPRPGRSTVSWTGRLVARGRPPRCIWTTGSRRCGRSTAGRRDGYRCELDEAGSGHRPPVLRSNQAARKRFAAGQSLPVWQRGARGQRPGRGDAERAGSVAWIRVLGWAVLEGPAGTGICRGDLQDEVVAIMFPIAAQRAVRRPSGPGRAPKGS